MSRRAAESPIAPSERKRRRFQFRLRTLMITVTLLAVPMSYVGWQAKIVRERKDLLHRVVDSGGGYRVYVPEEGAYWSIGGEPVVEPPFLRALFGDETILGIWVRGPLDDTQRLEFKRVFSDIEIAVISQDQEMPDKFKGRKVLAIESAPAPVTLTQPPLPISPAEPSSFISPPPPPSP
jgi:hypothetical protein